MDFGTGGLVNNSGQKPGRFILATNDMEMSADGLLANNTGQGAVERGFRFLKDTSFRVAEVFLKNTSCVQALAMIIRPAVVETLPHPVACIL